MQVHHPFGTYDRVITHTPSGRNTLTHRHTKKWLSLAATVALGVGLVACSSDDDSSGSDTVATEETTAATEETTAPATEDTTAASEAPTEPGSVSWETNFTPWDEAAEGRSCRESEDKPLKAAWVYVGPINDGGWTTAHNKGREAVQAEFGDDIITTYKENVPEGDQTLQVIEDLVADGNTLIFGTSFGFQDAFATAAEKYPEICFEFATGFKSAPNLSQFTGAAEDAAWLTGMAAGAASKTGKLGLLASFPIPEVLRGINAWTLGARAVNPEATVNLVWTNTWFDPALERKTAEALIADGADTIGVVAQDSPASGEAANEKGVPWSGYDSDQSENFPDIWLSAATYDWSVYEIPRVKAALEGTWVAGNYYGDMADGHIVLAPLGNIVTEETRALIAEKTKVVVGNSGVMFTGPLKDNKGNEILADGVQATYGELMEMNYLVEGINGEIPG
jgi:basic membrane lipoprotein Med (substrate-binding protein (PBP1-ABC) superfamily)